MRMFFCVGVRYVYRVMFKLVREDSYCSLVIIWIIWDKVIR